MKIWPWSKKDITKKEQKEPIIGDDLNYEEEQEDFVIRVSQKEVPAKKSSVSSDTIIIQLHARKNRPYMGYELLQALLAADLRFGEMNLFHRHEGANGKGPLLFSVAAATSSGVFEINNMGGFVCGGLVLFMKLNPKKKLMDTFDLMLDTARQLADDLGGEMYDEANEPLSAGVLKQLRERICGIEGNNQYTSDLLDNL